MQWHAYDDRDCGRVCRATGALTRVRVLIHGVAGEGSNLVRSGMTQTGIQDEACRRVSCRKVRNWWDCKMDLRRSVMDSD